MADGLVAVVLVAVGGLADLLLGQRVAEVQMDIALLLLDAEHDALQVLVLRLDILLRAGNQDLARLQDVARLVFVGDAQRNDVQFAEILQEILLSAHVEHLEQTLLGHIRTVFRPSLLLGDPDRTLAAGDRVADILRQDLRGEIQFAGGNPADDLDHAVGADQVFQRLALEQIVSDADLRQRKVVPEENDLGEGRVQDDVAVVRHEETFPIERLEFGHAVIGEIMDGGLDHPLDGMRHDRALELVDAVNLLQLVPEEGLGLVGKDVFGNPGDGRMVGNLAEGNDRFFVRIRSDAFYLVLFHRGSVLFRTKDKVTHFHPLPQNHPPGIAANCPRN